MLAFHLVASEPVVAAVKFGGVSYWLARSGDVDAVITKAANSGCCGVVK